MARASTPPSDSLRAVIFQHTYELVLSGRKTQTRRVRPPRVSVGRSYAVQPGRGKKSVGRITVTGIRQERLGAISENDARAEGYANRDAFFESWRRIHQTFDPAAEVWVIEFRLGGR